MRLPSLPIRTACLLAAAAGTTLPAPADDGGSAGDREAPTAARGTVLGIAGERFTLDGGPSFLLGFSYYAGLGAPRDFIRRDLDDLRDLGFNWLRVWATWGGFDHVVSAVDAEGRPREPFLGNLAWLVAECDARGMVVDVTLSRHRADDPSEARGQIPNVDAHMRTVETIIRRLAPHRNWFLDLANERDVGDARFVGPDELRRLRARARELDPDLLVTASFGGHDLDEDDVRIALETIGVDFLAPHRPRHPDSPAETRPRTESLRALTRTAGRAVPIHYQEPFRRGYTGGWEPTVEDFLRDLRGAIEGGAAGWCFHNGGQRGVDGERPRRSFDLREHRLMDQLDPVELEFVRLARETARSASPPNDRP